MKKLVSLNLRMILSRCDYEDPADEGDPDACMLWRGPCSGNGPAAHHNGKYVRLRRLVWCMHRETDEFPEGLQATTKCLQMRCLNPRHILALSRKETQRLHAKAGTYSDPVANLKRAEGKRNAASAKLNHAKAEEIRQAKGKVIATEVGRQYGVSKQMVYSIWQGRAWHPIGPAASVFGFRP